MNESRSKVFSFFDPNEEIFYAMKYNTDNKKFEEEK